MKNGGNMLVRLLDIYSGHNEVPPYTQLYGTRDSLSHLRIFGCKAYPNIPLELRKSDHQDVAYDGILVGYSDDHILSYKIYVPGLNLLLITADVTFQECDTDGNPYDQSSRSKSLKYEAKERDISDFMYLKGTIHRDPEDGLLYVTKLVKIDYFCW